MCTRLTNYSTILVGLEFMLGSNFRSRFRSVPPVRGYHSGARSRSAIARRRNSLAEPPCCTDQSFGGAVWTVYEGGPLPDHRTVTVPVKANQDRRHHIPKQRHRVTNWAAYD